MPDDLTSRVVYSHTYVRVRVRGRESGRETKDRSTLYDRRDGLTPKSRTLSDRPVDLCRPTDTDPSGPRMSERPVFPRVSRKDPPLDLTGGT